MSIYSKKDVVTELIGAAPINVIVDTRVEGVVVPKSQKESLPLTLLIGHGLPNPIRDLEIGDEGIGATLSFNRTGEWCFIPWAAIIGVMQGNEVQIVWSHDVPEKEPGPKRPALSVVK